MAAMASLTSWLNMPLYTRVVVTKKTKELKQQLYRALRDEIKAWSYAGLAVRTPG